MDKLDKLENIINDINKIKNKNDPYMEDITIYMTDDDQNIYEEILKDIKKLDAQYPPKNMLSRTEDINVQALDMQLYLREQLLEIYQKIKNDVDENLENFGNIDRMIIEDKYYDDDDDEGDEGDEGNEGDEGDEGEDHLNKAKMYLISKHYSEENAEFMSTFIATHIKDKIDANELDTTKYDILKIFDSIVSDFGKNPNSEMDESYRKAIWHQDNNYKLDYDVNKPITKFSGLR